MTGKIKTHKELSDIIRQKKDSGLTAGFTNGCFDILHAGHVRYLRASRNECDLLVIGVNSDSSVKRLKGDERPLNPQEERIEVLSALEFVDYLTVFTEDTPEVLIKKLTPDILFKGGDWDEKDVAGADHVKANGGAVRIIPYVKGHSTTGLIERLREGKG